MLEKRGGACLTPDHSSRTRALVRCGLFSLLSGSGNRAGNFIEHVKGIRYLGIVANYTWGVSNLTGRSGPFNRLTTSSWIFDLHNLMNNEFLTIFMIKEE